MRSKSIYQTGGYSTQGYKYNSPDRNKPFNVIPSGNISMKNVPHRVYGQDNYGNGQMMYPEAEYQFPGQYVHEIPIRQTGGQIRNNIPLYQTTDPSHYDQFTGNIYVNPQDYNKDGFYFHEAYHDLQNREDRLSDMNKWEGPLRKPSIVNSDNIKSDYYNRRQGDVNRIDSTLLQHSPDMKFVPKELRDNKFNEQMTYRVPWSEEGEAVNYANSRLNKQFGGYNMKKSKGFQVPGFKYGGNKLGGLAIIPDNNPWSASAEPVPVEYMRATNGMMQMGGQYLDYTSLNPALSGMQYGGGTRDYNNGYTNQDNNHINYIDDKTGYHNMQTPGQHYTNDGFKKSTGSTMNGQSYSKFGGPKFQNFMPTPTEYAYLQYGGYTEDPVIKRMGTTAADIDYTRIQKTLNNYNNEPHYQQSEMNQSPRQIQDIINRQIITHGQQLSDSNQDTPVEEDPFTSMNYDSYKQQHSTMQFGGTSEPYYMKEGGIYIKPENRGKFNATKAKTGKTTEELTHSSNPITKKRAIFAQNASHWSKKEFGGALQKFMKNGGDVQTLRKFMQDGRKVDVNGNPIGAWGSNPNINTANTPQTITDVNSGYNDAKSDTALANDPVAQQQMKPQSGLAPVSPQYATNDQPIDVATDNGQYTQQPNQPQGPNGAQRADAWGTFGSNTLLGLTAAGNAYGYQQGLKNGAQWNRQHGTTDTAFAAQKLNTAGNHGNYNQQGHFRPDANTPYNPGIMYPTAQMGGYQGPYTGNASRESALRQLECMQHGGQIHEMELEPHEIQRLKSLGYTIA